MDNINDILKEMGLKSIDDLFSDIPSDLRISSMGLDSGLSEDEIRRKAMEYASMNKTITQYHSFLGFGCYNHYVPAIISAIISRGEFLTAYTPYQAEISQGIMQALWEYQSLMAELLEMDAVNSSNYDVSTALGEAIRMAVNITDKDEVLIPKFTHPFKKSVARVYARGSNIKLVEYPFDESGRIDLEFLKNNINEKTAAVYVEYPNMFGIVDENVAAVKEIIGDQRIMIAGVNPISLGVLTPPGQLGADIAIGDGQVFGLGLNFGGPMLGIFGAKIEYIRKMPGKIMGVTRDSNGKLAFAMILQTREQHIRRERAVTNMTSNMGLMAVASAIYVSLLGESGLRKLGEINMGLTNNLIERIRDTGIDLPFQGSPVFNEFYIKLKVSKTYLNLAARKSRVIPGAILGQEFGFDTRKEVNIITNVTERNTKEDFDAYIDFLMKVI